MTREMEMARGDGDGEADGKGDWRRGDRDMEIER